LRPYVDVASLSGRAQSPKPDDVALTYTLEQIIQIEGWLKAYRIEVDIRGVDG
jgi:hypothetical protein